MSRVEARYEGYTVQLNLDADGNPMCHCCAQTMVEIKPGTWMCANGVAVLAYLKSRPELEPQ